MRYSRHDDTYMLRFEDEETFPDRFLAFLAAESIVAGAFTGIGAMMRTRIAFFDIDSRQYQDRDIEEQLEVLALVGNVAMFEGEPLVHAHVTLGRRDGSALGGHLKQGIVRPTLEVTLRVIPEPLSRAVDPTYGLPSLELDQR